MIQLSARKEDGANLATVFSGSFNAVSPLLPPDWRWRYCLSRLGRLEHSSDPEVFFDGPAAADLLSDPIMTDYLYPYFRLRLGYGDTCPIGDETIAAIDQAMDAAGEKTATRHSWSLRLEAGVLARRPVGEAMSLDEGVSRLGQIVYERVFFDVRSTLDSPRECAALLCANADRLEERGALDLEAKVVAYGLGFDEFEKWRRGSPSRAARSICRKLEYDLMYLDGLRLLRINRFNDVSAALGRRLESVSHGITGAAESNPKVAPTREEIKELMELVQRISR